MSAKYFQNVLPIKKTFSALFWNTIRRGCLTPFFPISFEKVFQWSFVGLRSQYSIEYGFRGFLFVACEKEILKIESYSFSMLKNPFLQVVDNWIHYVLKCMNMYELLVKVVFSCFLLLNLESCDKSHLQGLKVSRNKIVSKFFFLSQSLKVRQAGLREHR